MRAQNLDIARDSAYADSATSGQLASLRVALGEVQAELEAARLHLTSLQNEHRHLLTTSRLPGFRAGARRQALS